MSGIYVKYIKRPDEAGYKAGPLGIIWPGRAAKLDFNPRDDLGGLRAEEFSTEEEAGRFVRQFAEARAFEIDAGLVSARDRAMLEALIDEKLAPIRAELEALKQAKAPAKPKAKAKAPANGAAKAPADGSDG